MVLDAEYGFIFTGNEKKREIMMWPCECSLHQYWSMNLSHNYTPSLQLTIQLQTRIEKRYKQNVCLFSKLADN